MFTIIVLLIAVLMTVYTAIRPELFSITGLLLWGSIIAFPVIALIVCKLRLSKIDIFLLLGMSFVMFAHYVYTSDALLSLWMYIAILLMLIQLRKTDYSPEYLFLFPILGVIIQSVLYFPSLRVSMTAGNDEYAFLGFFQNSNTCSIFSSVAYLCSFVLIRNRIKYVLMLLCLINMYGGMSRNAFLFIMAFHAFNFIQQKLKSDKLCIYLLPVILLFAGYILLFQDVSSSFSMFGKEGTTGRSIQIIYLFEKYDLNFWGYGRNLISDECIRYFRFPPHNMYFYTMYGMGIAFLLVYVVFIVYLYNRFKSKMAKSALLAMQIYYFFEPVIPFEGSMSFLLPFMIFMAMDKYQEITERKQVLCLNKNKLYERNGLHRSLSY